MWGVTQQLEARSGATGPANLTVASNALSKVSYKRPETWSFLFTGRIVAGTLPTIGVTTAFVLFDLYFGVGRSMLTTRKDQLGVPVNFNSFAMMRWDVPVGTFPGQQNYNIKYCTQVLGPPLDDTALATRDVIDHIVAQDITASCRLVMTAGDPGSTVQVEVGAYFAPRTHVRPDWFADVETPFLGQETGGT